MVGANFSNIEIVYIPKFVTRILTPSTNQRMNNQSRMSARVAFVPRFRFSSSLMIED